MGTECDSQMNSCDSGIVWNIPEFRLINNIHCITIHRHGKRNVKGSQKFKQISRVNFFV